MSLLITLALLTWVAFLNGACGLTYKYYEYAALCGSVSTKERPKGVSSNPSLRSSKSFAQDFNQTLLTSPRLAAFEELFLWAEAGCCFIQSNFSLSQDSLIKSVSWLKLGRNDPIHQPGMCLFDHFLGRLGRDAIYSVYGARWQWVMQSWRHSKWESLWTFPPIKFKIWIKEPFGRGESRRGSCACMCVERCKAWSTLSPLPPLQQIGQAHNRKWGLEIRLFEHLFPSIWILKMDPHLIGKM